MALGTRAPSSCGTRGHAVAEMLAMDKGAEGQNPDDKIDIDMHASKYSDGNWSKVKPASANPTKVQKSEIEILSDTALNVAIKEEHEECALRRKPAQMSTYLTHVAIRRLCVLETDV